eukprot:scaffold4190_cov91-Skeletonema_dohrnii-CCMP3373.AAC.2
MATVPNWASSGHLRRRSDADTTNKYLSRGNCDDVFLDLINELGWNVDDIIDDLPEYSQTLMRMKGKNQS